MLAAILGFLTPLVDRFFDNKDQADKFKAEISAALLQNEAELRKAQRDIIIAEAQGQSWLQRNWRPILMLSIVVIVVNNYVLFPYARLFGIQAVSLDLPPELFNLMTVGVGGYVLGRSGEKMMTTYKDKR